tara:strand:+ start:4689 stop:5462 length:774 start_codon:yes stop_codon:yes gene_type:complete
MDFVSADRSGDQEHTQELKNYNFTVADNNKNVAKQVLIDKASETKADKDIDSAETGTQIKDGLGEAGATGQAVTAFSKLATTPTETIQQVAPTTEPPPLENLTDTGGGVYESGTEAVAEGAGSKALKGLGGVGAVVGMGMAIEADRNGGWSKMSTADKIGNVVEIGGAGLDLLGLGLEFTPFAPLGLALQGVGTLAQVGAGAESSISSAGGVAPAKAQASVAEGKLEQQDKSNLLQARTGVSEAQAGTLGIARTAQN